MFPSRPGPTRWPRIASKASFRSAPSGSRAGRVGSWPKPRASTTIPSVSFNVAATAYDRFMGRYSVRLSPQLADLAGVQAGERVLDVGCGPGALTAAVAEVVGAPNVGAVDPSEPFVEACRARVSV